MGGGLCFGRDGGLRLRQTRFSQIHCGLCLRDLKFQNRRVEPRERVAGVNLVTLFDLICFEATGSLKSNRGLIRGNKIACHACAVGSAVIV